MKNIYGNALLEIKKINCLAKTIAYSRRKSEHKEYFPETVANLMVNFKNININFWKSLSKGIIKK